MGTANHQEGFRPTFDRTGAGTGQFASWRSDPWTTLHHQLVLGNILRHLPASKSLRVLDVDSDAFYAVELARRGCFVELVTSDEEVLERARHQVATEGVAERLRLIKLEAETYLFSYRSASFNDPTPRIGSNRLAACLNRMGCSRCCLRTATPPHFAWRLKSFTPKRHWRH